jgi:chromosome segregation ATPase
VHAEIAEIKNRLALIQQAAEQSRAVSTDAADRAGLVETRLESISGHAIALSHVQEDLHIVREQLTRTQDDINSLRQSREEVERRLIADGERVRQDRNDISRRFSDYDRHLEGWQERLAGVEEHTRRSLESVAQIAMRLEAIETDLTDFDTLQSRLQSMASRMDQELLRLSGAVSTLEREDAVQRERVESAQEMLRRLEAENEAARAQMNRLARLDDRLELVQAERTRHNERLNDMAHELAGLDARVNENSERMQLVETRMGGYQESIRALNEKIEDDRETIRAHLRAISDIEADFRKRQISALEKEARDLKAREINFLPDE